MLSKSNISVFACQVKIFWLDRIRKKLDRKIAVLVISQTEIVSICFWKAVKIYLDKLQEKNFKLTPRRIAIIAFFLSRERYLSPEVIWKGLKKKFKHLGLPSIYRNLELFSKCGILTKIQMPDRRLYYGLCKAKDNKHHHHIVCIKCGKVGEFFEGNLFKKKRINGFKVLNHFLQIEGICSNCRIKD